MCLFQSISCSVLLFSFKLNKSDGNHLLQVDVMKKVATVRVVKDQCHREPGMQGNQGDELKAMRSYLVFDTSEMAVVTYHWMYYFVTVEPGKL